MPFRRILALDVYYELRKIRGNGVGPSDLVLSSLHCTNLKFDCAWCKTHSLDHITYNKRDNLLPISMMFRCFLKRKKIVWFKIDETISTQSSCFFSRRFLLISQHKMILCQRMNIANMIRQWVWCQTFLHESFDTFQYATAFKFHTAVEWLLSIACHGWCIAGASKSGFKLQRRRTEV